MALNLLIYCTRRCSRRTFFYPNSYNQRFLSTGVKQYGPPLKKTEAKQKAQEVKFYLLRRFVQYIQNYDVHFKRKFPKATQIYQVFKEGVRIFYYDLKNYVKIITIVYTSPASAPLAKLTRNEIEIYHQLPKDIRKVAPILLFSALPFSLYLILPLIYLFPRQLMTSHFWTLQQKSEFKVIILRERLIHNRPVFRHLQLHLKSLKGRKYYDEWAVILGQLGSGVQPTVEQILEVKPLFTKLPYRFNYLSGNHIKHLSKMHHTSIFLKRRSLRDRAFVLKAMDQAIVKEGGVHNMPMEALKHSCYLRGLNPTNMKTEDMIDWMNQWIKISENVDAESYSLLLHCPILLGYNQPSNWTLIYPYRE